MNIIDSLQDIKLNELLKIYNVTSEQSASFSPTIVGLIDHYFGTYYIYWYDGKVSTLLRMINYIEQQGVVSCCDVFYEIFFHE